MAKRLKTFSEKATEEERFAVIISYDVDSEDRTLYKSIHDPLSKEQSFEWITDSTYRFERTLTAGDINKLIKQIHAIFIGLTSKPYGNTSRVKLIISNSNDFSIIDVIPVDKAARFEA